MCIYNRLGYDRPPSNLYYVHVLAWLEAHYAATISAFSRRNLSAAFGFLVLSS